MATPLFARICQPSTPTNARTLLAAACTPRLPSSGHIVLQRRSYKRVKGEKRGRIGWKDDKDRPGRPSDAAVGQVQKKSDKSGGFLRPLPPTQIVKIDVPSGLQPSSLDLPVFEPAAVTAENIGSALEFPQKEDGPLRIFGMPKKTFLEYRVLSKLCSVIRDITVDTIKLLEAASQSSSLDTRVVLSGRPGCGKSFLLMQAVEYCALNDWIVLYIPRGVNLVNSTTPHVYDARTQTYLQPAYAYQLLQRLQTVNAAALSELTTSQDLVLERRSIPAETTLSELITYGTSEQSFSPIILDALMRELGSQTKYPVLLAVDDFQALYCKTAYRDPHFASIRPYHLSIPRLITEFACGSRSFARGAVLGAINASDPSYAIPLELREALSLPHTRPPSPYDTRSRTLIEYTDGLRPLAVPDKLSVNEAASIYEIWMKDKAFDSGLLPYCVRLKQVLIYHL
ncbi:hypothetical protein HGRIS_004618 [Hohenbuehelia grisea]|uniref:Small ribosomal subunit protein mS29 n=1 Tax=Hohenbuehelia grisea TaxID=104357 RepID=A0ABR3JD93_9AGAR